MPGRKIAGSIIFILGFLGLLISWVSSPIIDQAVQYASYTKQSEGCESEDQCQFKRRIDPVADEQADPCPNSHDERS